MQAEYNRGRGFIVSPLSVPIAEEKKRKKKKKEKRNSLIAEYTADLVCDFCEEWKSVKATLLKVLVTLLSVTGCIFFFCNFFTVGTAIYKGNELVAYSSSEEEYTRALLSATEYSPSLENAFQFQTSPVFTLRSNIKEGNSLRDKLLISTGTFNYGCTLYSGDSAIFTAENEETAKAVVGDYISSYSENGEASTDAKLTYRTAVIPVSEISDKEKCLSLLYGSGNVPVVSVVNTSQEKDIPFETQTEYDANLYIGESVTVTEGKAGSAQIKSQTIYKNGELESSQILSENIVVQPVTQIIKVGTKPKDVLQSGLFYPLTGTLSSPFGERWGRMHEGIDIAVPVGTSVKAAECGTVIFAGNGGSYGNLVKIDHGNGVITAYAHLDKITVSNGQAVNSDTEIAKSGNTGRSTGPHLHFEIVKDGTPLNPDQYLKKR